jgi:uncharacterized protein (TIGR02597 family)
MKISSLQFRALSVAILCAIAPVSPAQTTATTDPVGFTTKNCLANSDTIIGLPVTRTAEYSGSLQSISGNVITMSGSPGWTDNQFVYASGTQPKTYFALLGGNTSPANPKEGSFYKITASSTNTLTVNLNGDDISSVPPNTQLTIIPYWTLGTVFPSSDSGVSFVPTTLVFSRQTEILLPDTSSVGVNLPPPFTYFFFNGAWRLVGTDLAISRNDEILSPGDYFTVRNKATATALTNLGGVLMKKLTNPLATSGTSKQDNFVSLLRPVDVKLNDLGLITSGAFTATTQLFNRKDELFTFNNSQTGINKGIAATYFYYSGAWRKVGQDISEDFGNDTIPLGGGFIIRKAVVAGGATAFWVNDKAY